LPPPDHTVWQRSNPTRQRFNGGRGRFGHGSRSLGDLQHAIDQAQNGDTLLLSPGVYSARPTPSPKISAGNCQAHRTTVNASHGFIIKDKALRLVGAGRTTPR